MAPGLVFMLFFCAAFAVVVIGAVLSAAHATRSAAPAPGSSHDREPGGHGSHHAHSADNSAPTMGRR